MAYRSDLRKPRPDLLFSEGVRRLSTSARIVLTAMDMMANNKRIVIAKPSEIMKACCLNPQEFERGIKALLLDGAGFEGTDGTKRRVRQINAHTWILNFPPDEQIEPKKEARRRYMAAYMRKYRAKSKETVENSSYSSIRYAKPPKGREEHPSAGTLESAQPLLKRRFTVVSDSSQVSKGRGTLSES